MTREMMARRVTVSLLAVTAGLLAILSVSAGRIDPCRSPSSLSDLSGLPESVRVRDERTNESSDFSLHVSGSLATDPKLQFFKIVRSDEASMKAADWLHLLRLSMVPERRWKETVSVDGEPITIAWSTETILGEIQLAGRIQFLGLRSVDSVLRAQIRSAIEQLRSGSVPLTVYIVEIVASDRSLERKKAEGLDWLVAGVRHFRAACGAAR